MVNADRVEISAVEHSYQHIWNRWSFPLPVDRFVEKEVESRCGV